MRVVLLVGDSYMAYLLTRRLFEADGHHVVRVVLSTRYRGSLARTSKVVRGKSRRWLLYRAFVEVRSRLLGVLRGLSVARVAARHGVPSRYSGNLDEAVASGCLADCDAAIAINLDQVISKDALTVPPQGVYNIHAGRLPFDRGVSPALWAYVRGDNSVWVSFYRMDEGIDTGPLLHQIEVLISRFRSALKMYEHVCRVSGEVIPSLLTDLESGVIRVAPQPSIDGNYNGVPDARFDQYLGESGRRLIGIADVLGLLKAKARELS